MKEDRYVAQNAVAINYVIERKFPVTITDMYLLRFLVDNPNSKILDRALEPYVRLESMGVIDRFKDNVFRINEHGYALLSSLKRKFNEL